MNSRHPIFDFNVHLPTTESEVDDALQAEASMAVPEMLDALVEVEDQIGSNVEQVNLMLFNPTLFVGESPDGFDSVVARLHEIAPESVLTTLIDFRHPDALQAVDRAREAGVDGLKFHSYFQNIGQSDFQDALRVALRAQRNEMFLCVDTSYGTSRMFSHDNLQFAAFLSGYIDEVPLILLHSGGLRALEAMLLAESNSNVWLETSFSINYWRGSRVEQDLAFAYDKLGSGQILYGSDFPYVSMEAAIEETMGFFEYHEFNSKEVEAIVYKNAERLTTQITSE